MAYIPKNARWYLADLVMQFIVENESDSLVHINTILVRAHSAERAYQNALRFGQEAELEYHNTTDEKVRVVFRGLHDLNVIHEPLRSGSELIYQARHDLTNSDVEQLLAPKEKLAVFAQ